MFLALPQDLLANIACNLVQQDKLNNVSTAAADIASLSLTSR